jgi:hypothetical protein
MGVGGQMQKSLWNRNTQMCAIYGSDGSWMHESRGRESRANGWMKGVAKVDARGW